MIRDRELIEWIVKKLHLHRAPFLLFCCCLNCWSEGCPQPFVILWLILANTDHATELAPILLVDVVLDDHVVL